MTTDLLGRLQLWSVATQIIKLSSLPTVRRLNKVKTIFQRSGTGVSLFCFQPFEYLKTFDPGNKIFDLSGAGFCSRHLALVVQKIKRWITLAIQWITQLLSLILIRWVVIYPVDSAMKRLNNWDHEWITV